MPEVMHSLVSEARKNRFSLIPNLSEEDIISVWDSVSDYVELQMCSQRGVHIPNLGTFTFIHKKLDIGNNKFILIQRPVFAVSEKFTQTHGLLYTKVPLTGEIPVVQLNFTALSIESVFNRDTVEQCVREVLQALSRAVANQQSVEFLFRGIGVLSIKDSKVKMKFFKDFLNSMDGSGNLLKVMENELLSISGVYGDESGRRSRRSQRPGTADSVMSTQTTLSAQRRPGTNTITLPRLNASKDLLPPITENRENEADEDKIALPPTRGSNREVMHPHPVVGVSLNSDEWKEVLPVRSDDQLLQTERIPTPPGPSLKPPKTSRSSTRSTPRKTTETVHAIVEPETEATPVVNRSLSAPLQTPEPPTKLGVASRTSSRHETPTCSSPKHHHRAGQELCYLCMQRSMRNIPVSFEEERKRKEMEQNALLQQYQQMKDQEAMLIDKANQNAARQLNQKIAAFNLGVADCVKETKTARNSEFVKSYVFQNRPLTPLRFFKQEEYSKALESQVKLRNSRETREKHDREFQERLEQVQLAEDLAAQREQFLRAKADQITQYQRALSAQIRLKKLAEIPNEDIYALKQPALSTPQFTKPFEVTDSGSKKQVGRKIRSKPLPLPKAEPDSREPIFGRYDATNEKLLERKERSRTLLKNQLDSISEKKKKIILQQLTKQKEENEMLNRTKQELIADRMGVHKRAVDMRKSLESNWRDHHFSKLLSEEEERMRCHTPGMLLLQQTEKYRRCGQCQRKTHNCGETNIWSESRYIPGSRLMV